VIQTIGMFKKPLAHQSNATPLRSSARRQLLGSISSQYPSLIPAEDGKEVGRLILPEGVRSSTFETSGGVDGVSILQLNITIEGGLMIAILA
jgi:translation initiation factor 2D